MSSDGSGDFVFVFYHYEPSVAAAAIFAVIFFLASLLHTVQIVRTRTWYFIPMVVGGLMEGIGYVGRIISHQDTKALGPYILQSVLLLVAPALFAASIYMILGRLIVTTGGQEYSVIRPTRLTKVFVFGDVFSFLVQSSGAGLMAKGGDSSKTGQNIVLAGLVLQIIFFGFFVVVAFLFHTRMDKSPTAAARAHEKQAAVSWKKMLWALYAASLLIMIRSVFRLVEYTQGNDGYLLRNEVWLYIFDAVLMSIAIIIFNYYHPSKAISDKGERYEMGGGPLYHQTSV